MKLKLELLNQQEPSFLESLDLSAVDAPDVVYKKRIVDMEQMEQHLKEQVRERSRVLTVCGTCSFRLHVHVMLQEMHVHVDLIMFRTSQFCVRVPPMRSCTLTY